MICLSWAFNSSFSFSNWSALCLYRFIWLSMRIVWKANKSIKFSYKINTLKYDIKSNSCFAYISLLIVEVSFEFLHSLLHFTELSGSVLCKSYPFPYFHSTFLQNRFTTTQLGITLTKSALWNGIRIYAQQDQRSTSETMNINYMTKQRGSFYNSHLFWKIS